MAATILLAVIVHKLPQMVANIALGSGHNGAVGSVGVMTMIGAAFAATSLARGLAGAAGAAGGTAMTAHQKLLDRISVGEAANAAGNGNGTGMNWTPTPNASPTATTGQGISSAQGSSGIARRRNQAACRGLGRVPPRFKANRRRNRKSRRNRRSIARCRPTNSAGLMWMDQAKGSRHDAALLPRLQHRRAHLRADYPFHRHSPTSRPCQAQVCQDETFSSASEDLAD